MRKAFTQLRGTGVALVTPFLGGKVDFGALSRLVDHIISGGVEFLVALGTTGESVTLSLSEQRQVLQTIVQAANGRCPVIAGQFGGNDTADILSRFEQFDLSGITAIMSSSPAYNKPSQEGIFQHYMAIAERSPLPILIYNVPGRTASNLEPQTTIRLAEASEQFIGIKEASGDILQVMHLLKYRPDNFLVLSGDDPTAFPLVACGGDGCISVIGNAFPRLFSDMIRAALREDRAAAAQLNDQMFDIHPWLYIDGNPAGIKTVLQQIGLSSDEVRLPLVQMERDHKKQLVAAIQDLL